MRCVCMKLRDDNHLHIDEQDPIADWLVRSMRTDTNRFNQARYRRSAYRKNRHN